jgi:hypothetical protein
MKQNQLSRAIVVAGALMTGVAASPVHAQSSDPLLDKLVEKGILTTKEAKELREESDQAFTKAAAAKTGMPEWVSQLKIYGDVRARIDNISAEQEGVVDRLRYRGRARVGLTAKMLDNFEAGIRFSTSDTDSAYIGDPISANATYQRNGSRKYAFFDLLYGKWTPLNKDGWMTSITAGKMENPFVISDMEFDPDYDPEGIAIQGSRQLNKDHSLKWNLAAFALDELSSSSRDSYMLGGQVRWDGKYAPKEGYSQWESSLGLSVYGINSADTLTAANASNVGTGNTRDDNGVLLYHYNPIVVDASITYNLPHAPLYNGAFPIKVSADFMQNPAAPDNNTGWWVGFTLGKAGKKRTWEFSYRYKELQGDAWYEEVVDSDYGAYYGTSYGGKSGYASGTNVRGHIFKAVYQPAASFNFTITYFLTELIDNPADTKSGAGRLLVDANWKF